MYFTTFSGFAGFRGEQCRHELDGIVGLEPRRVIREQSVGGGVRLVEAVSGELLHEVEDLSCRVFWVLVGGGALHEAVALLGHFGCVFLAHGAAKQVGVTERVAGEDVRDLHDLFLVDDDAEGLVQDDFEFGQVVADGAAAPLALDEVVDHAAFDGARAVECVEGGEVFDGVGLVAPEDVAHAAGLELEDAGGEGAMEDLFVCRYVVERHCRHVEIGAGGALDELERVVDDGEGRQAEEVHLEKAHLFDGLHVVGGDDVVVLGAGDGDEFSERLGCDDDAGGVYACAADEAFEAECGVDELFDLRVALVGGGEDG